MKALNISVIDVKSYVLTNERWLGRICRKLL